MGDPPHSDSPEGTGESSIQPAPDAERTLFVFSVAGVDLALPPEQVDGVSAVEIATAIPGAPRHVMGLVAVGDRVLPLVDLELLLDLTGPEDTATLTDPMFRRTILVRAAELEAGLVCHRARGLIRVRESALREPTVLQGSQLRPYITAEVEVERVVGLLDLPVLLRAAAVS